MSKKRRPTARDRDIVDFLKAMQCGQWHVDVEALESGPYGISGYPLLSKARLKREGSMVCHFDKTMIMIWPELEYPASGWKTKIADVGEFMRKK